MQHTEIAGSGRRSQQKRLDRAMQTFTTGQTAIKRWSKRKARGAVNADDLRALTPDQEWELRTLRAQPYRPNAPGPRTPSNGPVTVTPVAFNPVTDRSESALVDGPMLRVLPGDRRPGPFAKGAQKMSPERHADLRTREIRMRLQADRERTS